MLLFFDGVSDFSCLQYQFWEALVDMRVKSLQSLLSSRSRFVLILIQLTLDHSVVMLTTKDNIAPGSPVWDRHVARQDLDHAVLLSDIWQKEIF